MRCQVMKMSMEAAEAPGLSLLRRLKPLMARERSLVSSGVIIMLLVFGTPGLGEAINTNYSCPFYPVMGYGAQNTGISDPPSEELTESGCRGCHGSSLAERHHTTPLVVQEHRCSACHAIVPGVGLAVTRDCTTSGCHHKQENRLSSLTINPDSGPSGTWIKISLDDPEIGGSFGSSQTQIFDDGYHGVCRIVDFISSQGTFTALAYRNWSPSSFEVKFSSVFKDSADSATGIRDYVQDSGNEPTITGSLASGQWAVSIKSIHFGDSDHNTVLSSGDIIYQVDCSDSLLFTLSARPVIYSIIPTAMKNNNLVRVSGTGFNPLQGSSRIRIGSADEAQSTALGLGEPQDAVLSWSSTAVKIRVNVPPDWSGKVKYLWMEKGREKSNCQRVKIR
ncbi:MAG: hypothetical protein AB1611_06545 [bacterium]